LEVETLSSAEIGPCGIPFPVTSNWKVIGMLLVIGGLLLVNRKVALPGLLLNKNPGLPVSV
jgi:hypothetical protein